MKRFAFFALLLCIACKTPAPGSRTVSMPGHGAISVQIMPNPIVAKPAGGNNYDFPVDVIVHETGGRAVTVSRVTATIYGPAGIRLGDQAWCAVRTRFRFEDMVLGYERILRQLREERLSPARRD